MRLGAFQLDETEETRDHFRVVRTDELGNVVGEFIFREDELGDVELEVRRFDEAAFGSLEIRIP